MGDLLRVWIFGSCITLIATLHIIINGLKKDEIKPRSTLSLKTAALINLFELAVRKAAKLFPREQRMPEPGEMYAGEDSYYNGPLDGLTSIIIKHEAYADEE